MDTDQRSEPSPPRGERSKGPFYPVREVLREMETLTKINYSGKYGHILTELTKPQKAILKVLDIPIFDPASL